jgi:predicted transposase YbfD/YdcC
MTCFDNILEILRLIHDPRDMHGKIYALPVIMLLSIMAVLTGANSYRGIRTFIKTHFIRLKEVFELDWKQAPAYTSIRNILIGLDPSDVEKAFRDHAAHLDAQAISAGAYDTPCRVVALDGKVLRGSFDNFQDQKAKQILSAFATDTGLILAHIEIDEKSNEIPAAQQLLQELKIPFRIATLDAIHCQKKTFEIAKEENIDMIIQLKDNQPTLSQAVETHCTTAEPLSTTETRDRSKRNRSETRKAAVFDATHIVAQTDWESYIKTVIQIEREVLKKDPKTGLWTSSNEKSFYLSNCSLNAEQALHAVRCHWHIENKLHHIRDVTFKEDESRIRHKPGIFARFRSWAGNILKINRKEEETVPQQRYAIALGGIEVFASISF